MVRAVNFCKDCRHFWTFTDELDNVDQRCARPREPMHDLVTGREIRGEAPTARHERYKGECGPLGKFFEARKP